MTSTPLTVRNAEGVEKSHTTIEIDAGVKADLTLAGVYIECKGTSPLNLVTNLYGTEDGSKATDCRQIVDKTTLHLTLADATENTLWVLGAEARCTWQECVVYPALRCAGGSVLTIDDSRRNIDQDGLPVDVEGGKVTRDAILADGTEVKKGDSHVTLDSPSPGRLFATSSGSGAAIGGGSWESAGTMTFNGGNLRCEVRAFNSSSDGGAGIGAGNGGLGTDTTLTFNSGVVDAIGAEHAAGIGGGAGKQGYAGNTTLIPDWIISPDPLVCGNITINGGYLKSKGGGHGAAFGMGCNTSARGCTIKVTGGTLLPTSVWGWPDLGGYGGNVVISGGSVRVSGKNKFVSASGSAYGSEDYTTTNEVFMVAVDLSGEKVNGQPLASEAIVGWQLTVGGVPRDYGAPTQLDEGKLYLWLPRSDIGKEIDLDLVIRDESTDDALPVNSLMHLSVQDAGLDLTDANMLKRLITFPLPDRHTALLHKDYDGLPLASFSLADDPILTTGQFPRLLDNASPDVSWWQYQPYSAVEGRPLGEMSARGATMPAETGFYRVTLTSSQYALDEELGGSYWGHRGVGWGVIDAVPSAIHTSIDYVKEGPLRVSGVIAGGPGTAVTCKAPTGSIEVIVDGEVVGTYPLAFSGDKANASVLPAGEKGPVPDDFEGGAGERTVFALEIPADEAEKWLAPPALGNVHRVSMRYAPAINYEEAESEETGVEVPDDPTLDPQPTIVKTAENLTRDEAPIRPGDLISYRITATCTNPGSTWKNIILSDAIPVAGELLENSLVLEGPGTEQKRELDIGDYTFADGILKVPAGDLISGQSITLALTLRVRSDAGNPEGPTNLRFIENIGEATGIYDPDNPKEAGPVRSEPATPAGGGDIVAPVQDPEPPADDPTPGNPLPNLQPTTPTLVKTAQNLNRDEGRSVVNDTVRYTLTLDNQTTGTWLNAVLRDDVPIGLEPLPGTLSLSLPDGTKKAVSDKAYDSATRILSVFAGSLAPGEHCVLAFDVRVTPEAVGRDIGNSALAYGTPIDGASDPDAEGAPSIGTGLQPGDPFTPTEGWDALESLVGSRLKVIATMEPVYPLPNDRTEGVLTEAPTRVAKHALAQTGDTTLFGIGILTLIVLTAGAFGLASRRRQA